MVDCFVMHLDSLNIHVVQLHPNPQPPWGHFCCLGDLMAFQCRMLSTVWINGAQLSMRPCFPLPAPILLKWCYYPGQAFRDTPRPPARYALAKTLRVHGFCCPLLSFCSDLNASLGEFWATGLRVLQRLPRAGASACCYAHKGQCWSGSEAVPATLSTTTTYLNRPPVGFCIKEV